MQLQDKNNYEQEQDINQQERLPEYAQVEGQKIYLRGLDYSLLEKQKQTEKNNKKNLMDKIKLKIINMQQKLQLRNPKIQIKTTQYPIFQSSIELMSTIKQLKNIKPLINSSSYYIFDIKYHFGKLMPDMVNKRFGRMNRQPVLIKIKEETIKKLGNILDYQKLENNDKRNKLIKTILEEEGRQKNNISESQSQSDDIFGSQQSNQQQKGEEKKDFKKLFNFGKGLDLGVKNQDIFKQNVKIRKTDKQLQQFNNEVQNIPMLINQAQKDKYQFLRKKIKKNINGKQQDDGYTECYYQTGPTFDQMKQYKAQGIQIWGDIKQNPKKPQRKINIHKDYEKVKKIIDEKYSKK